MVSCILIFRFRSASTWCIGSFFASSKKATEACGIRDLAFAMGIQSQNANQESTIRTLDYRAWECERPKRERAKRNARLHLGIPPVAFVFCGGVLDFHLVGGARSAATE